MLSCTNSDSHRLIRQWNTKLVVFIHIRHKRRERWIILFFAHCLKRVCRCVSNRIYHPLKGTSEWKQSWPPYWRVVPNQSAQNWPLQKGRSECRISKATTDVHFGPPWSFAQILSMMTAPPCGHGIMTQKGTSRNSCLVPYTLQSSHSGG